jgi:hypothetical protein
MFISGPKVAAAMSDKHNIVMYISGKSLPTLSQQSHKTAEKITVTSTNRTFPPPNVETSNIKLKKSHNLKPICVLKADVVDLNSDSDSDLRVCDGRGSSSRKRKAILLSSDSDDD